MITKLTFESFKSLEKVEVHLGQINVFVGANGSGKSNLLEGLGVLSAAAKGRVDDEALMRRGVRPGVPQLYKSAFPSDRKNSHIFFGATNEKSLYEVSLLNPLRGPTAPWRFKTELWEVKGHKIVSRAPRSNARYNPEQGLAALEAANYRHGHQALKLLNTLQEFAIYAPNTPTLRGISPDAQPREPVGLSGGGLPQAVRQLMKQRKRGGDQYVVQLRKAIGLIDWARSIGYASSSSVPLSPSAAASQYVVRFRDRFMEERSNVLTGYDASEGALYVLFVAALALCKGSPKLFAIDNVDQTLNPRLARRLAKTLCDWMLEGKEERQVLMTAHNPAVLDGLPLENDRVRLFTVGRSNTGRTIVRRVEITQDILERVNKGWSISRLWLQGHLGGVPNNV